MFIFIFSLIHLPRFEAHRRSTDRVCVRKLAFLSLDVNFEVWITRGAIFRIGAKQTMTHLSIHFFSWPWSSSMLNLNIFFFGADPLEKSGHLTKLYLFLFERLFTGVASPREIELIETLQQHAHACWSSDDVEFYHAPCRVVVRCSHQSDEMMVTVECWGNLRKSCGSSSAAAAHLPKLNPNSKHAND